MKIQSAKAGIGTGRAGLQAASGLFSNAGLFDKGVKSFNPLDLDPYLLFDAQTSMIGTLENPTLDLDPSKQDTLDVITATRAGTATYTDFNGNIATAQPNTVRVDQTQGAELTPTKFQLIPYSTPDSNWATVNSTLVEDFDAAPDGTQSASKVTKLAVSGSGSSNDRVKYQNISIANGTTYTVSVHLKNIDVAGYTTISARVSGGSLFRVRFIWDTSALSSDSGTTSNRLVEDVGNGWYRVSFSFDANGSAVDFEIDVDRSTGGREDNSSILVWGAQLEEGTTASSFVENTTGSPKFITGATFGPRVPMILVEPSATNLVTYSEDFSNSYWTKSGTSSVTPNTTISPDGTLNADTISNATGTSTSDTVYRTINPDDVDHTFSAYVKSAGATTMSLITRNGINGVILSQAISLTDEWQRVTLTHNIQNGQLIFGGSDGDFHLWGAQFESGSVATSYIPTSGGDAAARTRAADNLVISGSAFSSFYNASEGTVYTESVGRGYFDFNSVFAISDNSFNESIYQRTPSNNQVLVVIDGGNVQASLGSPTTPTGTLVRRAASFKLNNFKGSHDGVDTNSDTSGTIPTVNRLHIGASASAANKLNGHIKRLIYWPYHSDSL